MTIDALRAFVRGLVLCAVSAAATGCLSPKALQPVARQNQQNLADLTPHVVTSLTLAETYFGAASQALLLNRVSQVHQELIAIAGGAVAPATSATWETLFEGRAEQQGRPYLLAQFQSVKSILNQPGGGERRSELSARYGWIVMAASDPSFTPARAHQIVQALNQLRARHAVLPDSTPFIDEAIRILGTNDPVLDTYVSQVQAARSILQELRQSTLRELNFADSHARAILAYTEAEVDTGKTIGGILSSNEVSDSLTRIAEDKIKDPKLREGALALLSDVSSLLKP